MKTLKNKILAGALALASLTFGANQLNGQDVGSKFINKDQDEFSEEIICWKREGFDELIKEYKQNQMGLTILYWEDKNNDNFHENIKIFNCNNFNNSLWIRTEDFYIDKSTGLIDYNRNGKFISKRTWNKYFADKDFIDIARGEIPSPLGSDYDSRPYLTQQDLYDLKIDMRLKKLINCVNENQSEMKRLAGVERDYFKTFIRDSQQRLDQENNQ